MLILSIALIIHLFLPIPLPFPANPMITPPPYSSQQNQLSILILKKMTKPEFLPDIPFLTTRNESLPQTKRHPVPQKQNIQTLSFRTDQHLQKNLIINQQHSAARNHLSLLTNGKINQCDLIRKLQNIKHQLQHIPNWQQYARSIFFNECSQHPQQNNTTTESPSPKKPTITKKLVQIKIPNQENKQEKMKQKQKNNSNNYKQLKNKKYYQIEKQERRKINGKKIGLSDCNSSQSFDSGLQNQVKKSKQNDKNQIVNTLNNSTTEVTNVDKKIIEIQRKIRETELQKKKLGVDFIPFQRKCSLRKSHKNEFFQFLQQNNRPKSPQTFFQRSATSLQPQPQSRHSSSIKKQTTSKPIVMQKSLYNDRSPRFAIIENQKDKIQRKRNNQIRQSKQHSNQKQQPNFGPYFSKNKNITLNSPSSPSQPLLKSTEQSSSKNRIIWPKQQDNSNSNPKPKPPTDKQSKRKKQDTAKLVYALCQQVLLDEKLKNSKLWFKNCKQDKYIKQLQNLLNGQGFNLSLKKIQQQFQVHQKQDNPFFSVSSQQYDIPSLANAYIQSQKHWCKQLHKKFSRKTLQDQDLNNLTLDLDRKGFIVLEDLVRFLNMETGKFLRSRDLIAIFKRIGGVQGKVSFQEFLGVFCG